MSKSLDLGGEGNAFPFEEIGDKVRGKIVSLEVQQQTDLDTGEPKNWPNGQPMTMVRVELQTRLKESRQDDGIRSVYIRGSKKAETQSSMAAVLGAVKDATGTNQLQVGGDLELELIGEEAPKKRGWNGRKLYAAAYEAPSVDLDEDDEEIPARPAKTGQRRLADQPANDDEYDDEEDEQAEVAQRRARKRTAKKMAGPEDDPNYYEDDLDRAAVDTRPESLAPRPRKRAAVKRAPVDEDDPWANDEDEDDAPAPTPRMRRRPVRDIEDDDASDALRV